MRAPSRSWRCSCCRSRRFASRRRWSAYVLGGSVSLLAILLFAVLFTPFSDAVSLSQARRAAGFLPLPFAFAGGAAVLARTLSWVALPVALGAGIALELVYPGEFTYTIPRGKPGDRRLDRAARRGRGASSSPPCSAAAGRSTTEGRCRQASPRRSWSPWPIFGFAHWSTGPFEASPLTSGVQRALEQLPDGSVVFSDDSTSYWVAAAAPLYVASALPGHVADTKANRPFERRDDAIRFGRTGDLSIPRRYGADYVLVERDRWRRLPALKLHLRVRGRALRSLPLLMKVLLVPMYFPPAGGGGVQRPLKFATFLPELGIETHVLAPDDPKWLHRDDDLKPPTQAWIHRAHYVGPSGGRPADALHGTTGVERYATHARLFGRRLLLPDENVSWALTAIPAAVRLVREEKIDVVLTTSPPGSIHLVGAAVQRMTGARWVADLRDSLLAHPHRRADSLALKAKERSRKSVAGLVARRADAIVAASEAIAEETRGLDPKGRVVTITNGCDFDDFDGIAYKPGKRFRITHTGSFFGRRDPRPFLTALADSGLDVQARFVGDFRPADREWAEGARPRRPARAARLRPATPCARAPARLGGAAAPDPRGGRPWPGRAVRQGVRVPRDRAADPRRRARGRSCGGADRGDGRRRRRSARRSRRDRRGAHVPPRALAGR